jgi:hypothetical protein
MSAAPDWTPQESPDWTPEELWVIAFGERLRDTSDAPGIGRRREEIAHAEAGGKITEETAVALRAEVRKRRFELFEGLRSRHDRPTLAAARQGRRTFTPRPFPGAGPEERASA